MSNTLYNCIHDAQAVYEKRPPMPKMQAKPDCTIYDSFISCRKVKRGYIITPTRF